MHDAGLIRMHLDKIRQISVKAATTEDDFSIEIDQAIADAISHISIVKTSDPTENLQAFAGQLNVFDQIETPSFPRQQEAMKYASASFKKQIESR